MNRPAKQSRIPILSFFTGGGFLDLGFEEAGFTTVWTNEFNSDIADMFEHGMTALLWQRDPLAQPMRISSRASITELSPDTVLSEAFGGKRPKIFGVIGGPPCPDFSVGGKNRGRDGDQGRLSKCYIEMICGLKPTFFLMENVPGLVRTEKHRLFLGEMRSQLRRAGYATDVKILNALDYGVPQDRERVFMVGLLDSFYRKIFKLYSPLSEDGWFPYPAPKYPNAKALPWPELCDYGIQPKMPKGIYEEFTMHHVIATTPPPTELPNGTEGFVAYSGKFYEIAEGDVSRKSFKRLHRFRYSPTACYGNNEVHLHPWEPRRLTVREALRVQSMPDEYVLPAEKSLSIKFKMIGNGVPRLLGKAMADSIKNLFS